MVTASGTVDRGGSIIDKRPTKQKLDVGKFIVSTSNEYVSGNSSVVRQVEVTETTNQDMDRSW